MRLHGCAAARQIARGGLEVIRVLGGDQQVKAVAGELAGEFQPDAVGAAGNDGEGACVGHQ